MSAAPLIVIAAGGTGGHVFPGLAVAEAIGAAGGRVLWLGAGGRESEWVTARGVPLATVQTQAPAGALWPARLALATMRALRELRRARAEAVLAMGGYACVPCGLAARLLRLPLLVHEQNAMLGRANKMLARLGATVLCGMAGVSGGRWVGNPVRQGFVAAAAGGRRRPAAAKRFLVLGGSQGAAALNAAAPAALAQVAGAQVLHQCGRGQAQAVRQEYARHGVDAEVREFVDDVAAAMAAADLALCRAGAATLAELAAAGLGAALVPYPHAAAGHQLANARRQAAAGAALLCEEHEMTAARLAKLLTSANAAALGDAAARLAAPNAAQEVAKICMQAARQGRAQKEKGATHDAD